MSKRSVSQWVAILLFCTVASAQAPVPPFSGVWELDLRRSKIESKDPPSASVATIRYNGTTWDFSRTHHFSHKPIDT